MLSKFLQLPRLYQQSSISSGRLSVLKKAGDIEAFGPRLRILKPYVKPITAEKRERLKMGQVDSSTRKNWK